MSARGRTAERVQREFEKQLAIAKRARLLHVAKDDLTLGVWALAERFDMAENTVRNVLREAGLSRRQCDEEINRADCENAVAPRGYFMSERRRRKA